MTRVKFSRSGDQRNFLLMVLLACNIPSLRELSMRMDVNYSTFKNYCCEDRLLPSELFENLTKMSGIRKKVTHVPENFGQIKGGKSSKK